MKFKLPFVSRLNCLLRSNISSKDYTESWCSRDCDRKQILPILPTHLMVLQTHNQT